MNETTSCVECWKPITVRTLSIWGRPMRFEVHCDECAKKAEERALQDEEQRKAKRREEEFLRVCPPIYQESDPSRLLPVFKQAVEAWRYGPLGLGFIGQAGTGKTRCAWMLLKRMSLEGRRIFGLSATQFARAAAGQWQEEAEARREAIDVLGRCRGVSVLLLDDLGKQKMTERVELELFDVLEWRTSHAKPTIWTANASPAALKQMMSADRGEPILRRLMEFSEVINPTTKTNRTK